MNYCQYWCTLYYLYSCIGDLHKILFSLIICQPINSYSLSNFDCSSWVYQLAALRSAFHPDSGELQNVFGRMSFQVEILVKRKVTLELVTKKHNFFRCLEVCSSLVQCYRLIFNDATNSVKWNSQDIWKLPNTIISNSILLSYSALV